ncbi:hypothetical protein AKJ51_01375, partial [candidate division MSBL1 archaeon SCGC-AAA382A20]
MESELKIEVKSIEPVVQSNGYWIGERTINIVFGKGKEYSIPELAIESAKVLNRTSIYSILLSSSDKIIPWDIVLEYMSYMHEHYKISISTQGVQHVPEDFMEKSRTFISLTPSLEDDFDFSSFERNTLKIIKNEYYNYEIVFTVERHEDIKASLSMLSSMVAPKHLTIVYQPP